MSKIRILFLILIFFPGKAHSLTFVFAHGYGRDWRDAQLFAKESSCTYQSTYHQGIGLEREEKNAACWYIIPQPVISFDFPWVLPGSKVDGARVNKTKVSFGQKYELEKLHEICSQVDDPEGFVLVGYSLGGASSLMYAALYAPSNLRAVIAIGAFDRVESAIDTVLQERYGIFTKIPGFCALGRKCAYKRYSSYNPCGLAPVDCVGLIHPETAVLIVHSQDDEMAPITCARANYKALKRAGHKKSWLLELEHGVHRKMYMPEDYFSDEARFFKDAVAQFLEII